MDQDTGGYKSILALTHALLLCHTASILWGCMEEVTDGHVDVHVHDCDSAFLFWGDQVDGAGLICEVEIEGERHLISSPASIFIPAGILHTYRYVYGRGTYTNILLAPHYNESLLEHIPVTST